MGVSISLNNSSSLSFVNVYAPSIRFSPTDGRSDSFPPSILPFSRNLFIMGDFNCHHPYGTQKVPPTLVGRKYSTGSSLLISSRSTTLTYVLFSIALLLTSPLLLSYSPFLAPGRCFRIIYQFFYLSLSLQFFAPTSVPFPSTFRKLAGMTLPFTLTLTVLLQRNTCLFLFPLLLLSSLLWH